MKLRNIIIATVLLIALACYSIFFESKSQTTDRKKIQAGKIFDLSSSGHISRINCQNVVLEMQDKDSSWIVTQPFRFPAHPMQASVLEESLRNLIFERELSEELLSDEEKSAMGLADVRKEEILSFIFVSPDGDSQEYRLQFGADTPIGNSCYVRVPGSMKTYIINKEIKKVFHYPPEELIKKVIFQDISFEDCRAYVLQNDQGILRAERKHEKDFLMLIEPYQGFIDYIKFESRINALKNMRIDGLMGDIPLIYKDMGRIRWKGSKSATEVLIFHQAGDTGHAAVQLEGYDSFFSLPVENKEKFSGIPKYKDLLINLLTPFISEHVKSVQLQWNDGRTVFLENTGNNRWAYSAEHEELSYSPFSLVRHILHLSLVDYKEKSGLTGELKEFMRIRFKLFKGTKKDFIFTIVSGEDGPMYSTMDNGIFAEIEDVEKDFLKSLSIPETKQHMESD